MLTLFTLQVLGTTSDFFAGNGTSLVGGTTTATGVPPMENGLLGSCKCGGGKVKLYGSETTAQLKATDTAYGCIGGCEGSSWEIHASGQLVKKITMWYGGGPPYDGMGGMCIVLTNGDHKCVGTQDRGTKCEYEFDIEKEEQLWTLELHGNGHGSRLGRLAFRTMLNDGSSKSWHCGDAHTPYKATNVDGKMISGFFGLAGMDLDQMGVLLSSPRCDVLKREITKIECVDKSGDNCLATWTDGGKYATVQQICDGCKTTQKSTCAFDFSLTQTHSVTTTSTSMDTLGGSLAYAGKFEASFFGLVKAETTVTVTATYSHTWSSSEAQTTSSTTSVDSRCAIQMDGGKSVMAYGTMHAGDMVADMKFTVTTTTKCGQKKEEVHQGTVTMSNVAVLAEVATCTFEDVDCDATMSPTSTPAPTAAAKWTLLDNTNISGGDLQGCSKYPGKDIRKDDDKIAECQRECAEYPNSDCFAIVAHPWGTMLKSYTEPTKAASGYKTYVIKRSLSSRSAVEEEWLRAINPRPATRYPAGGCEHHDETTAAPLQGTTTAAADLEGTTAAALQGTTAAADLEGTTTAAADLEGTTTAVDLEGTTTAAPPQGPTVAAEHLEGTTTAAPPLVKRLARTF